MEVGVRELRGNLSQWIEEAKHGKEVVITERGRPVAKLGPIDGGSELQRLIASGLVQRARAPHRPSATIKAVPARGSVSDLVAEQRR